MQRVLQKKKQSEASTPPHTVAHNNRRLAATAAASPSQPPPPLNGRRHAATLYHHKSGTGATATAADQVVVGLSASNEDEVEDWSGDFLASEPQAARSRWRRQDSVGTDLLLADTLYKRRSSSSSNGVAASSANTAAGSGRLSGGASQLDEEDSRALYSSYSSVKDAARVGRPQPDQPADASDSDEDWDAEFGFDEQADATLGSSGSMDPTRRRAENGNFFLPNLHEVLDGESLPDDDEMDGGAFNLDGAKRQRRPSEEPLFQRRRGDFHQSGASVDGSVDGVRSSLTSASASSSNAVEYSLVDKLRLLEVANSSAYAVRIERYPKPSSTFSNLERDRVNFPSFTENKYERWLADLAVPDCAVVSQHMEAERNRLPPPRQLKNQQFHALVSLPFGREFVDTFFKQITHYRYFGEDKENRELVRMYFEKVSTTGMTDENWAQNLSPGDLDFVVGCSMEVLQEAARLYGPKPVVPLATHLSLSMLSTASSASSQGNKTTIYWIQQFQDILVHCAEAFPQFTNVVALVELRYVCHHLAGFASGEYEYKWQICNQLPAFLPLEPVVGDSASQIVNEVLQYYGALFQHLNTSPESRSNRYMGHKSPVETRKAPAEDARQFTLSPDVICLQGLVLCDIQSLYDSKSALAEISLPALEELLEFEDDEATVDPILVGLLPHNRDSRSSSSSSNQDYRDSGYERGDLSKGLGGWSASVKLFELLRPSSRSRNSALSFFYERIPAAKFPLVKAKCASVLAGMHVSSTTSHGNLRVAETLAYEALRLLEASSKSLVARLSKVPSLRGRDKAPVPASYLSIFNNDGLLSDLGREALEGLGNILIKNNKYRYGILCLEAAGALFSFLNQGCEYEKLDRLLCKLTLEADDVHRALPLHEKVTCAAQRQGNITVYVYLTQEMTKLWIREGNFTRAEEYLATACHFLRDHTNLLPPHFLSSAINGSYSSSEAPSSRSGTMMTATSSSVSSSLSGSFHLSSRSGGNASEVDTWLNHDINLHLLVRDVYRSSGRCLEGMRVIEHLLNYSTRLPRGKRTQLRMLLAEDALKMRMFDTCRHMFSQMEREATAFCDRLQENIKGFSGPGSSSGTGPGTSSSGGGRSLGGMGSEARYSFDMSFTLRFIVCRVKMYLKLGDFGNAFAWLSLAHVKNDRDNVRKQAQLYVLDGKVLRAFCREQQEREWQLQRDGEESTRRGRSTFVGRVVSPAQVEEMLKPLGVSLYGLNKEEKQRLHERMVLFGTCVRDVDKAEEQAQTAFWTAFDLYRVLDDSLHQLKVLLEVISFMLAPVQRSFFALGSNQDDEMLKSHLYRRSSGKGSSILDVDDLGGDDSIEKTRKTLLEAQKLLRLVLNLAEQVANPACFLRTLIFCSEVWVWLERIASYKSEKHLKEATAFWEEAVRIMKGVFFRRVAFHDVADASALYSSGFGNDFTLPYARGVNKGRFCVVPILNFSEGFIVKLEAMTLQLILTACQLQQFERVPDYVEETLLQHLDELLSARMCLSSIVHQLQTFRALQKSHKRLPPSGSAPNLAAAGAAVPSGSSVSVSSVGSSNSRSSSFSAVIPVPSPQMGGSGKQVSTPSPSAGVAAGKRAGHKKNQSMSSISELLASNTPSPYPEGGVPYSAGAAGGMKSSATPRTGLASLSERPNVPPPLVAAGKAGTNSGGHSVKKSGERKTRRYTRERSRSAPQPAVPNYPSPNAELSFSRTGEGHPHEGGSMPVLAESGESSENTMKRTSSVKFIDLGDLRSLPPGEDFMLGRSDGFARDEGSSSNGAIGLCDFDEVQSEKLWWIFNLWRDAKAKYVDGKIETSEFRSRNLRYLRTLLDAFDPQQIAVLYFGGMGSSSTDSVVTPGGTRVASAASTGNPNGMLDFDVSRMNSHALIQDGPLVLSVGYEYPAESRTPFGAHPKLQFKVFSVRENDTSAWRQEIPRPDWYLTEYDMLEAEEAAGGVGVLRTMRLLGAKLLAKLLGVLLLENSVVVVGSSYPQIQEVTTCLLKLLEPFRWQHTFLPFVPVTSWRLLHDAAFQHAQAELAARPKSRRSFSRLSHDWRAWSSGGGSGAGSSYSSSRGSTDSLTGGGASSAAVSATPDSMEEEPPFLLGATSDTWQSCLSFSKKCGNDPRLLTSCVVVVDLDDVDALAADRTLRNAVPLPKKWRRQFLERIDKVTRQRHKLRVKMSRRHSSQQLVSSRGPTTPASASGVTTQSMRSPAAYPPMDVTLRSFDDSLSTSRSGSSWMMTPVSASGVSDSDSSYQLMQSGVQPTDPNGLDERKYYDAECAAAFVSGVREFYDKLLVLCAEKERKAKSGKKKKSPSSSGHSKRQEIKSWFSSSHDFDAFVDNFQCTDLLEAFEKEKAAAQAEAQAQARAMHQLERQSSEQEVSSTSSGRSGSRFGTTPKSIVNSFTPQQLKSFGSFSSLTASNRSSGGQERRR
jgi:hypothetical protein